MWITIITSLAIIITIAVLIEKKSGNPLKTNDFTAEEKDQLDEDYIRKGRQHETDDPEKL